MNPLLCTERLFQNKANSSSKSLLLFYEDMNITVRKHWMSLAPCSSSALPRQHDLPPCSESSERICPLEILKSKEQEGTATSLGICTSKKQRYIKDCHYFWGRSRQEDSSVHPRKCLTLPENMLRCNKKHLWQSPSKPQPSAAGLGISPCVLHRVE